MSEDTRGEYSIRDYLRAELGRLETLIKGITILDSVADCGIVPRDFQDVPFARRPIWSAGSRGTPYIRWVPYGMPQLGRYKWILDMVFFLYRSEEDAIAGTGYGGTGFFVSVPSRRWPDQYHHHHGVTNWHVACQLGFPVM